MGVSRGMCVSHIGMCVSHIGMCVSHVGICVSHIGMCVSHIYTHLDLCMIACHRYTLVYTHVLYVELNGTHADVYTHTHVHKCVCVHIHISAHSREAPSHI